MKKAHVELYLRLEKSVYKLGETINVYSECRVEGGITDVKKVSGFFDFIGLVCVFIEGPLSGITLCSQNAGSEELAQPSVPDVLQCGESTVPGIGAQVGLRF